MNTVVRPIEKNVVLVGAGNAHLVFIRRFGMNPMPGVAVTLVSEAGEIPYSAMVTGHIAGDYRRDEITIDLVRLCAVRKVRFVAARVERLDPGRRQVLFAERAPLHYDVLSLGLGSLPACPGAAAAPAMALMMRPMGPFLNRLLELETSLKQTPRPCHFAVVGGGASGCELALAIHQRLGGAPDFRMTLLHAGAHILPDFPAAAAAAFHKAFEQRGIAVRVHSRATGTDGGLLLLENGERLACDAVLWATNAAPPQLLRASGLALNDRGFVRVTETLQSVTDPAVFATGDCVAFDAVPDLPRNGVHAVRQGAVLFDNIAAFLQEQPVRPFEPQRLTLSILNTADGSAVVSYGALAVHSRWARRWKDRIDRAWIEKYQNAPLPAAAHGAEEAAPLMRCGGCGSKISSDILAAVLRRLDSGTDPRVLLGCGAGEDAAVYRLRPELFGSAPGQLVEVQTVDYFKSFVDDPYLFGRIAALHALSDLYAMNARPFAALAIATLPYARGPVQEAQLYELLSGALATLRPAGVVLTGGHTTEGAELALGFAVTGHGEENRLFQKGKLQPGDHLVLTKPLGSGALLAAWMRGACRAPWFDALVQGLLQSNAPAAAVLARHGIQACTDITGFGLAGHLLEMLDPSRAAARITAVQVPLYDGFQEVVRDGIVSTLQRDNAAAACRVQGSDPPPAWLFDPQTSGGLLAGVRPEQVDVVLRELHEAGCTRCAVIGVVESAPAGAAVIRLA